MSQRDAWAKLMALGRHQEEELTPTMKQFTYEPGVTTLTITDETGTHLQVQVRHTGIQVLHIRFPKSHKQGVLWRFRDSTRLNWLAVEESLVTELTVQ